jgi:hypothetical protein
MCYLDADLAQEGCRPAQPAREGTRRVPWSPDPKRQFTSDCPSKSVPVNDLGQMANEVIE